MLPKCSYLISCPGLSKTFISLVMLLINSLTSNNSDLTSTLPSSIFPKDKNSFNISVRVLTEDLIRSICLSLLGWSSVVLYFANSEMEDKTVLRGVLNSCDAMDTNLDFKSLTSFSFSKDFVRCSLEASSSTNVFCNSVVLCKTVFSKLKFNCLISSFTFSISACCNKILFSYSCRRVISTIKAIAYCWSSELKWPKLISTGNSDPSFFNAERVIPIPIPLDFGFSI